MDPSINTLPYLFTLLAHLGGSSGKAKGGDSFSPGKALWQKTLDFLERFDSVQIRYAGNEFRQLFDMTAAKVRSLQSRPNVQAMALSALGSAILRVDPEGATFTSSHLVFVRRCLEARAYSEALPVLNQNIYYFPSTTNKAAENNLYPYLSSNHETSSTFITPESGLSAELDSRDGLQYFLFGAMCYMGLKNWKRAMLFLEIAITWPVTNNASKIQIEAYKKYVLVGLLYNGHVSWVYLRIQQDLLMSYSKPPQMPNITHVQVAKQCRAIARAYEGLAEVFKTSLAEEESAQRLIDEANAGRNVWGPVSPTTRENHCFTEPTLTSFQDCNGGLVRQVIEAFRQFSVVRLEKVYAALTVADITRRTSPNPNDYAETGSYLINLISSGKLNATITEPSEDPATWIIRFSDGTSGPLARSEEQQYEALVKQTRKIKVLMDHIREYDRKLSLSKEYINDAKRRKKEKADHGENGNPFGTSGLDTFDQDEDMMADL